MALETCWIKQFQLAHEMPAAQSWLPSQLLTMIPWWMNDTLKESLPFKPDIPPWLLLRSPFEIELFFYIFKRACLSNLAFLEDFPTRLSLEACLIY